MLRREASGNPRDRIGNQVPLKLPKSNDHRISSEVQTQVLRLR
jgi:hypothetical protein